MQLSVYVGLRAIGWMVHTEKEVIQHGIKRLAVSFDNYYEYMAGLPVSKRINRRIKRQARRNLWRYKSRRDNLKHLLNKHGYSNNVTQTREQILKARVGALDRKLSKQGLYLVIMSLQRKRGYKSLRGVSDNENSDYLKEIERHETELLKYRSIAEYLLTLPSSTDIIFNRQSYINEFNAIMDAQEIDADLRNKIFGLIYYQNPLKKGNVGKCQYEKNRQVIHGSHPLYQEFRIWRDVMNIVIWDKEKNELEISFEQRKQWVNKLMNGSNITKAVCLKDLGLKKPTQYTWLSGKQIAGNPLSILTKQIQFVPNPKESIEILWQEIYSAIDNDKLATFLRSKYSFNDLQIDELLDLDFSKLGHGEFSAKAIRKLLPIIQTGKKLKHAILEVYGKVDFKNVALRNVILEQHYHAYQSLVEGLKVKYSQIEQIKFEIDPLLKMGNKQRKASAQSKRKEEKIIKEHSHLFKSGTPQYNAKKYRIWEECQKVSPYEPNIEIPLEELFTDKYNLDHIVPKSKLMESGEANLVISRVEINEQKSNHVTGIEFAEQLGIKEEYLAFVEKMPDNKQHYMKMSSSEIPNNWVSKRQNSDYNTRCFATIGNGMNIPNKVINKFIQQWRLPKYDEQDARYSLVKAYVITNFSQETIIYLDNVKEQKRDVYGLTASLPIPLIETAPIFIQRIKFTRKTKYGYTPRFALHGESVHGKRVRKYRDSKGVIQEDVFFKIRQPIGKLTPAMVEKIMDDAIKRKVKQRISEKGNHEDGIASLIEQPATHNNNPIKSVSIIVNAEKIFPLHSTDLLGNTGPKAKFETLTDFVFNDKNHRLIIREGEKGKLIKEGVPIMQFIDGVNAGLDMREQGIELTERSIVELYGKLYFVIGAGESLAIRPCYTLSATETYKVKAEDWQHMNKLLINQLGETKASVPVWMPKKIFNQIYLTNGYRKNKKRV